MENKRSLRQTLRRPRTDEEIFDRITPAKHSRSKSLLDVHTSRGVQQDREPPREHDKRAQEHEARSLGSEHSESESDSDGLPLAGSPERLSMAPRNLQNQSDLSPASALSSAYTGCLLDDYSIDPFLDESWPEQLTQWDSSVNRHARFALDMESSSGDEKEGSRPAEASKPVRKCPQVGFEILTSVILIDLMGHGPVAPRENGTAGQSRREGQAPAGRKRVPVSPPRNGTSSTYSARGGACQVSARSTSRFRQPGE